MNYSKLKKGILSALVILLVLTIGTTAYRSIFMNTSNNSNLIDEVTVVQFGEFFLYAPLYIAESRGYFEENMLKVNIISTGGDEKTFAALVNGSAQFGVADPTFAAISGERGIEGRVISSIVSGVPFFGVSNKPEVRVDRLDDLGKYSVATFPSPSSSFTLTKSLYESAGLEPNIVQSAPGTLLQQIENGNADISLELEPNATQYIQKNNGNLVFSLTDYYEEFAITGMTVLPEYIDSKPHVVEKMVKSIQQGLDFIHANIDEAARILIERFPNFDFSIAKESLERLTKSNIIPKTTVVSRAAWDAAVEVRQLNNELVQEAPFSRYVVNGFAVEK